MDVQDGYDASRHRGWLQPIGGSGGGLEGDLWAALVWLYLLYLRVIRQPWSKSKHSSSALDLSREGVRGGRRVA